MTEKSPGELRAAPGDRLVVEGHHQGEAQRDGEILEVHGDDGGPPFVVRWEDGTTTTPIRVGRQGPAFPQRVLKRDSPFPRG